MLSVSQCNNAQNSAVSFGFRPTSENVNLLPKVLLSSGTHSTSAPVCKVAEQTDSALLAAIKTKINAPKIKEFLANKLKQGEEAYMTAYSRIADGLSADYKRYPERYADSARENIGWYYKGGQNPETGCPIGLTSLKARARYNKHLATQA